MFNRKIFILSILIYIFFILADCRHANTANITTVPDKPGSYKCSINYDGLERTYYIHIPSSYDKTGSVPLVIAIHGLGGTGEGLAKMTGFNDISDKEGFIIVYPDGTLRMWKSDGRAKKNDDVGFISTLIDRLSASLNIDTERVYATGMSNGGFMCMILACELSDKIAAIAPVVATMTDYQYKNLSPPKPVPVLIMNGTKDPLVHWEGGNITLPHNIKSTKAISAYDAVKFWVSHNNCSQTPEVKYLEDKDPNDGTKVKCEVYSGGSNGTEVILYTIEGGGHTWPGGLQYLPEDKIGKTCRDINASEVIWRFFKKHERK